MYTSVSTLFIGHCDVSAYHIRPQLVENTGSRLVFVFCSRVTYFRRLRLRKWRHRPSFLEMSEHCVLQLDDDGMDNVLLSE